MDDPRIYKVRLTDSVETDVHRPTFTSDKAPASSIFPFMPIHLPKLVTFLTFKTHIRTARRAVAQQPISLESGRQSHVENDIEDQGRRKADASQGVREGRVHR